MEAAMRHSHINASGSRHQRGAALVVGLMLLVVITLLAIGGMNSASVELVMAGNTQYQQRAFETAEMGIEQTLDTGAFVPGGKDKDEKEDNQAVPDSRLNGDKFSYVLSSDLCGAEQPAIWGNSIDTFSSYHFQIRSVGASARNARTTHTQGVATISPRSQSFTPASASACDPAGGGSGGIALN